MIEQRDYQRAYLRAPFRRSVLFEDQDFVFRSSALNVSEGGILLDQLPHFPSNPQFGIVLDLPRFPHFKNHNDDQLESFAPDLVSPVVMRGRVEVRRTFEGNDQLSVIMGKRIGARFVDLDPKVTHCIRDYVDVYASNIIYMLTLLDRVNYAEDARRRVRLIAKHLGYQGVDKISLLRSIVEHEYRGLQWL